jgi:hypothetical protein
MSVTRLIPDDSGTPCLFELGLGGERLQVLGLRYEEVSGALSCLIPLPENSARSAVLETAAVEAGPQPSTGTLDAESCDANARVLGGGLEGLSLGESQPLELGPELVVGHHYRVEIGGTHYSMQVLALRGNTRGRRLVELSGDGMHRILNESAITILRELG